MTTSIATTTPQPTAIATADDTINAFASTLAFEGAQRMAKALSTSTLMPKDFQGNLANCLIAIELASRIKASVFMVAQNLYVVHGRPGWSSQFLIATVNASGRFKPLKFAFEGKPSSDDWGCRATSVDLATGEECIGTLITIGMAKAEGWYGKNGSKWRTMPEQMLRYRAAAFWVRVFAPELSLGMQTHEELRDSREIAGTVVEAGDVEAPAQLTPQELQARILEDEPVADAVVEEPTP